jgi:6-pyruvoyltetrahydropterin/6-carboxytetrahydropterin synthase
LSRLKYSYHIKSFFNASHAIRWESGIGERHTHTWEVNSEFQSQPGQTIVFRDLEKTLNGILQQFSGVFLNQLPYFKNINPTVENVTLWLYNLIVPAIAPLNVTLIRLEVAESPTRSYCISAAD